MLGKLSRDYAIDRKHDFPATRSGFAHDLSCGPDQFSLIQGLANRSALGDQKRIRHSAADDQCFDFAEQVAEKLELGGNFGPAHDRSDWMLWMFERARQRIQLGLHGATRIGGGLSYRYDAGGAGLGPMPPGKGGRGGKVAARGKGLWQ